MARRGVPRNFDIKSFLREASALERKGALRKTEKRGVAKATAYRRSRVKKLSGILQQSLSPVKRSRRVASEFREAGFTVVGNRVYFPKATAAKVRRSKPDTYPEYIQRPQRPIGGSPAMFRKLHLPKRYKTLGDLKEGGRNGELDKYKRDGAYFAFTLFGNNSLTPFQNGAEMAEWLEEYESPDGDDTELWGPDEDEYEEGSPWKGNLVLYEVSPPGAWHPTEHRPKYSTPEARAAAARKGWEGRKAPAPKRITIEQKRAFERNRKAAYRERKDYGGTVRPYTKAKAPSGKGRRR